jgi:1-aminocyclopropane-1-carboxylate deaminase/D-cysteine desulfhydrase-like pyridoxal-dependent ACC family enzyme
MPCHHLPRTRFAHLPTPLEAAPRLTQALGGPEILVKREDLCGLAFGGNKTRLMEYVIGDALERGIDAVVAAASPQSNKLREVAAAAGRFGMRAVLLVEGRAPTPPQGNLLLFDLLGAEVRFLDRGQDVLTAQRDVQAELERAGHRVAVLDRRLEYGALATAAYVDAARELFEQLIDRRLAPERIFVTVGAGMTHAGLVLGLKHLGSRARVVGVSVSGTAATVAPDVVEYARGAAGLLGLATTVTEADFGLIDGAHPGYGLMSPDVVEAIRLVAGHHGMVLDPVYNAKTMRALIGQIRKGEIGPSGSVVFVNTGGAPALFAHQAELATG